MELAKYTRSEEIFNMVSHIVGGADSMDAQKHMIIENAVLAAKLSAELGQNKE